MFKKTAKQPWNQKSVITAGDAVFMLSLCSLLSEEPKPSKHQELISILQEIALKKKILLW